LHFSLLPQATFLLLSLLLLFAPLPFLCFALLLEGTFLLRPLLLDLLLLFSLAALLLL
jgi:hypothetical protein